MFSLFENLPHRLRGLCAMILFLLPAALAAQETTPHIDQLLLRLKKAREDTGKVNLLDSIATAYLQETAEYQRAREYSEGALQLSSKLGWKKGQVRGLNLVGILFDVMGDTQKALATLQQALALAKSSRLSALQSETEVFLGYTYTGMKRDEEAIGHFRNAADYYLQTKERDTLSWFVRSMWWEPAYQLGYIYFKQKKDTAALGYYQQILNKCLQEKDTLGIRTALNQFIRYYNDHKMDYDRSIDYCFRELKWFPPGDTTSAHASVITYIANGYRLKKDYVQALKYYRAAIALKPIVHPEIKTSAHNGMREIYRLLEDYHTILAMDLEKISDSGKPRGLSDRLGDYDILADDYTNLKQYDSALYYQLKVIELGRNMKVPEWYRGQLTSIARIYYLNHQYDEALRSVRESIQIKGQQEYALHQNLLYRGMIVRDAPASVLVKYGIPPARRYPMAISDLKRAVAYFTAFGSPYFMPLCYKELSIAYDSTKDYKGFHDTYTRYIALRDSSVNRSSQAAFIGRLANIQYEKREDSLKYQQQITSGRLRQQTQQTAQQRKYFITGIIALLALSFFIGRNYYNQRKANRRISAEQKRSDALLLNILPADVAEELKTKGSADARLFEEVTVLFTDFVNFTNMSEVLTPQELVDELHHCFKAFDEIISQYGIEKIKTIGDAYLAVAGLPNADPRHAENVVRAALDIRRFIQQRREQMGHRSFNIRIGIHSGSVVAGIVGVKKFAYDIWGDTVNTAARMEQHSQPGQINLSEKTYALVKDHFAFTYRGEIEAKNKGALKMYFVEKELVTREPQVYSQTGTGTTI